MSALKTRVSRLEAEQGARDNCQLCELIAITVGETPSAAAALARHPRHTLEQLVLAKDELKAAKAHQSQMAELG